MRILLATYWGLPHVGGVQKYINNLRQGLTAMGHDVDIFCQRPDNQGYSLWNKSLHFEKESVFPIVAAKMNRFFDQHAPYIDPTTQEYEVNRYCFEVAAAYFNLNSYDLIHTQDIISTIAMSRLKPLRPALVSTLHGCYAAELFHALKEDGTPIEPASIFSRYINIC